MTDVVLLVVQFCGQSRKVAGMLCIAQLAAWLQNAADFKLVINWSLNYIKGTVFHIQSFAHT